MSNTISTLNVKLTATTAAFSSAMAGAARPLASFGSSVLRVGTMVAGFGTALLGLAAGGSLAYMTKQSMEAIDVNAKLADRLGLSTEGLVGLQHAGNLAGVSSEQLTEAMEKMLKSLGSAADDGELVSSVFTKLGLDAAALANMPADQAFATIAQRISEIQNPAERATAAMQIFGKSGQSLLPLMMSGAEGIKAAQLEAEKLGLTYSRVDAAKVEQANDAITKMTSIFSGIGNQLAIGLAPYIEAAANKFTELATAGGGIGPKVGGAIEWVARAIATAADYLQLLPAGFHGFRAGALQAIVGVLDGVDLLGGGLVKLMNLLPGVSVEWTDTFSTLTQGLEQVAAEEAAKFDEAMGKFNRGDNALAVTKVFEDIKKASTEAAAATQASAAKMRGAFEGLDDGSAADAEANLKKLADLDAQKKAQADLEQRAQAVFDETRTPLEKYEERIGELSDLLNAGAIDWDTYGRAIRQARERLDGKDSVSAGPTQDLPDLISSGSAQAARFAYDMSRGQSKLDEKGDTPKKQLAEQQDANRILERIARNTQTPVTAEVVEL
jgi:hypothetical protein